MRKTWSQFHKRLLKSQLTNKNSALKTFFGRKPINEKKIPEKMNGIKRQKSFPFHSFTIFEFR